METGQKRLAALSAALRRLVPARLGALFVAVLGWGIVSADPKVRRRQRFTNLAATALAIDAIAHLIFNMMHDFAGLMLVNAYNVVAAAVYLSLHRLHRYGDNIAANALIAVSLIGHSFVVFAIGLDADLHVYFTLAGFILFFVGIDHWRNFLVLYFLCIAALLLALNFAAPEGFVLPGDVEFRKSIAGQVLLSAVILNGAVIASVLVALDRAEANLEREYARSELLLTTILPATIAERLKAARGERIADSLDGVTVLFADLVGFTPAAAAAGPAGVVDYLHDLFTRIDALAEAHGVDKIKTIGDAYMAVGGLRGEASAKPADVGRLAFAMIEAAQGLQMAGMPLNMRIGIHHGPAIAGVIGDRRLSYDVWGDTVNIAARLESSGAPGRVHVSADFRDASGDNFGYEARGEVALKGVGQRETFFLAMRVD